MLTKKGEQTRRRICEAAVALINRDGYDAVTVAGICAEAGVSNGSFFHHFKAKDDVLVEFVRDESEELERFYESLDKSDACAAFADVIAWQADYYALKGEDFIAHLHAHLILMKNSFILDYSLGRVLSACIELGQQQGAMKSELDARQVGMLFSNDIMNMTSFVPWPSDGSIADAIRERGEFYLSVCLRGDAAVQEARRR